MRRFLGLLVLYACTTMIAFASDPPQPPPEAGAYPEPTETPRYLPPATVTKQAMVSAAHPLAARIGSDILKQGGNAIDATVAVQMALNVVEPQSSGIGGGCFIVYYDARKKETICIDGREECPRTALRSDFLDAQGKILADELTGGLPVGVPGTVAAMWLAHQRYGKLPWAKVLSPAIRLAEDGIGVTPRLRINIAVNRSRFLKFPSSKAVFLHPDGSLPEIGEVLRQPDLGRTLRLIAEQGPKVFYEGEIAQDIVKTVRTAPFQPGRLELDDLKRYRAVQREPIRFTYHGHDFISMPPPSSGGITLGLMLGILEQSDLAKTKAGSVAEIELLARAGAVSFADRNAYLGDQDWCPTLAMRSLLTPSFVKERAEAARAAAAGVKHQPGKLPVAPAANSRTEGQDTTHFSIVDADRNVVACTTTIEHGMGSGLVVTGRGFLLNNELTDFDLDREAGPNALDATPQRKSSALTDSQSLGGKRPRSSMTPVIVFKDGQPILTAGSPGGALIIGIVGQVLVNVLDHGLDMQQAINAPRLSSRNGPLSVEALYPARADLINELRGRGWKVQESKALYDVWGGAHGIRIRQDGTLEGGADPRREGAVRGY